MNDDNLKLILPHFVAIFLIVAFWRSYQYRIVLEKITVTEEGTMNGIRQTDQFFSVLLILFSIMALFYAYYPQLYRLTFPIDYLNEPTINSIGLLLLRLSLVWVVVAQLLLKRAIERFILTESKNPVPFLKAKKSYLIGMLVMFTGMMVTITNIAGIVFCNLAFMLFRTVRPGRNND